MDVGRFVHCCCEPVTKVSSAMAEDMRVVNVAQEHGFCRQETVKSIREFIRGPNDVLFYSSPCTGGSSLQRVNRSMYSDGGNLHTSRNEDDTWIPMIR
eukprot:1431104-Lingulodinium_polyedra.AAC.1